MLFRRWILNFPRGCCSSTQFEKLTAFFSFPQWNFIFDFGLPVRVVVVPPINFDYFSGAVVVVRAILLIILSRNCCSADQFWFFHRRVLLFREWNQSLMPHQKAITAEGLPIPVSLLSRFFVTFFLWCIFCDVFFVIYFLWCIFCDFFFVMYIWWFVFCDLFIVIYSFCDVFFACIVCFSCLVSCLVFDCLPVFFDSGFDGHRSSIWLACCSTSDVPWFSFFFILGISSVSKKYRLQMFLNPSFLLLYTGETRFVVAN